MSNHRGDEYYKQNVDFSCHGWKIWIRKTQMVWKDISYIVLFKL